MRKQVGPFVVALDANGNGTIQVGPGYAGVWWELLNLSTKGNSAVNPKLYVYFQGMLIDTTYNGNGDTSPYTQPQPLPPGSYLDCQYVSGSAGSFMSISALVEEHY